MKRFSSVLVMAMMLSVVSNSSVLAQPAMEDSLAADELILRVTSDEKWLETTNNVGMVATREEYQLVDGEPQFDLFPSALALYEKYGAQDVYYYVQFFDEMPVKNVQVSTSVETRILVFPDEASASGYLSEAYRAQVNSETAGEVVNAQFSPIEPLPVFDNPSLGWTFLDEYYDQETLEISGNASAVRYLSQVGRVIVSASATGPWVDFNFDLAYGLLNRQADCMMQPTPCGSVSVSEAAGEGWAVAGGQVGLTDASGSYTASRYIFPIDEPVRAPAVSHSIATPSAGERGHTVRRPLGSYSRPVAGVTDCAVMWRQGGAVVLDKGSRTALLSSAIEDMR